MRFPRRIPWRIAEKCSSGAIKPVPCQGNDGGTIRETKVESLEGNKVKVTVTVDAADIDGRIKKTYKDFARSATS